MRHIIETYWKNKHLEQGYSLVNSPHVARLDLWKTSGHLDFYKESMFDQMQVSFCLTSKAFNLVAYAASHKSLRIQQRELDGVKQALWQE